MSLFSRLRTVTLAYGNNLLDKVVDSNSIPVLKQYVRDLEDAVDKLNHEDAVAAANITVLQSQIDATSRAVALDTLRSAPRSRSCLVLLRRSRRMCSRVRRSKS